MKFPIRQFAILALAGLAVTGGAAAAEAESHYSMADFSRIRKFDAHVHANTDDHQFLDIAAKDGFEILSINVDYPDFPPLQKQAEIAHALKAADPKRFHFITTFPMKGFEEEGWSERTIAHINAEMAQGALGVKIWKNVGMVERDSQGQLIMLDDHRFDTVVKYLEDGAIPLIAHQAEPRNCWLPLAAMTTDNDRRYFRDHPEYYMFLHPEMPSYESLIAARNRFVARHPRLNFVGAHLASLEWSVDELGKFFDANPNATADLAARMSQVQYQSRQDRDKVRRFFIHYQDRLLYGTDLSEDPPQAQAGPQDSTRASPPFSDEADRFWKSDWMYLATPQSQHIDDLGADVQGLALPESVIDKIYYANARRVFGRHL